jgi:hypothetical protein
MGKTHRSDGGGNKAARVAQKEQAALDKQRAERAREDDEADSRWSQGAKRGGKKYVFHTATTSVLGSLFFLLSFFSLVC